MKERCLTATYNDFVHLSSSKIECSAILVTRTIIIIFCLLLPPVQLDCGRIVAKLRLLQKSLGFNFDYKKCCFWIVKLACTFVVWLCFIKCIKRQATMSRNYFGIELDFLPLTDKNLHTKFHCKTMLDLGKILY